MNKRIGSQTIKFDTKPKIITTTSIVGPKESQGPLSKYFDIILSNDAWDQDTYEKAECKMLYTAITETIKKAKLKEEDINYLFSGDLLNQTISSNYAARDVNIPFIGLYGACSTMAESLSLASMAVDGGFANYSIASTSSHFSTAERQFRAPLEMGTQSPPYSQWTVTGSGAMLLGNKGDFPCVTYATNGKVKDYGITDTNNMGSAMAPAAVDTIKQHFIDTKRQPNYYDLIVTGDLGKIGKNITIELLKEYGYDIHKNYIDCGDIIYNSKQNVCAGGSGCGCSAVVSCGYLYKKMLKGELKKILLVSTGALMSTTSSFQGESIPGVAHAVAIEYNGGVQHNG